MSKKSAESPEKSQQVLLDPFLIDRLRLNRGLSRKQLAVEAKVAFNTVRELFHGGGVQPSTARAIAVALQQEVVDLLSPLDARYVAPHEPHGPWAGASEWETVGYLEQGRLAPNALYYIVCRMRHRHTTGKQGRGKFYHLSWLHPAKRDAMRHQLTRHADVCARVGPHPRIVTNLTSAPVADEGWWVIDDWIGERTLADFLRVGAWPSETLPGLLYEIATGLAALHAAGIVFRELAPARVLISDKDAAAVLTDFELAKLLDDSPSVSSEWPEDPFRAPEVDGGSTSLQSDLYSFAQLASAAVAGSDFDPLQAEETLGRAKLPKRLQRLLLECLEPIPDRRPSDLSPLLKELSRWSEK